VCEPIPTFAEIVVEVKRQRDEAAQFPRSHYATDCLDEILHFLGVDSGDNYNPDGFGESTVIKIEMAEGTHIEGPPQAWLGARIVRWLDAILDDDFWGPMLIAVGVFISVVLGLFGLFCAHMVTR
jgi:hypothetical protein